jgi:hypothetical protein
MDKIFLLNSKFDKKDYVDQLIGQKGQSLYNLNIEEFIENNEVHRFIKQSYEYCTIKTGDTPIKALFKYGRVYSEGGGSIKDYRLIELNVKPGHYYPRVFRPFLLTKKIGTLRSTSQDLKELKSKILNYPEFLPSNMAHILSAVNQLGVLKEMLISILNTIYPSTKNLKSFGQSMKNILVLSCIEVETQLKGIYKAHEAVSSNNYTTKNYVKLKDVLQLDKYEISLPFYPDLKPFAPFKSWKAANPSTSLPWYNGYNAIKHNSEIEFDKATLMNAISSVCAVAILIKAQYGTNIPFWSEKAGSFFNIKNKSKWTTEEKVLPPLVKNDWRVSRLGL